MWSIGVCLYSLMRQSYKVYQVVFTGIVNSILQGLIPTINDIGLVEPKKDSFEERTFANMHRTTIKEFAFSFFILFRYPFKFCSAYRLYHTVWLVVILFYHLLVQNTNLLSTTTFTHQYLRTFISGQSHSSATYPLLCSILIQQVMRTTFSILKNLTILRVWHCTVLCNNYLLLDLLFFGWHTVQVLES